MSEVREFGLKGLYSSTVSDIMQISFFQATVLLIILCILQTSPLRSFCGLKALTPPTPPLKVSEALFMSW